jgi:hypothetical protein
MRLASGAPAAALRQECQVSFAEVVDDPDPDPRAPDGTADALEGAGAPEPVEVPEQPATAAVTAAATARTVVSALVMTASCPSPPGGERG